MLPPVHLAVGYLCWAAYTRVARGGRPGDGPALAAVFGAAVPDLVDKPLWLAGVVDIGRTASHSVLFTGPLLVVVWLVARWRDRDLVGLAFAIGLLSHLAADIPWHLLAGEYDELGFLFWPLTPMPEYTGTKPLTAIGGLEITTLWLEVIVSVAGVILWWHDGRPGLERMRTVVRS